MMTRALHPEGWTSSLEKAQKKLWGACAVSRLQERGACLVSCGCPSPSWLCWAWDTLQSTSSGQITCRLRDGKTYPHCGWEEKNPNCWMLASGDCQDEHQSWSRGCQVSQTLPLQLPLLLHRKESFNFLSVCQFPGECFVPLLLQCCVHRAGCVVTWTRRKKEGRTLASLWRSTKAGLGFCSCRIQCLGSMGIQETLCY